MAGKTAQRISSERIWALAARQHGAVAHRQLVALGLSAAAIEHRLATGRLHRVMRGVYAVGRHELGQRGLWMAAVLRCGPRAALSHASAAAAWEIRQQRGGPIEVSVWGGACPRPPELRVHRRATLGANELASHDRVPLTSPVLTLIDLAAHLSPRRLEAAVNEADKRELVDPEALRQALERLPRHPGVARLRRCLDRATLVLTDSELERRFLPVARAAGLPMPLTGRRLNGFKVDFLWVDLGLVVETDGLRYHRTPAQQARDRLRDQSHAAAGLTPLRFTHAQVRYEPDHVRETLAAVAARLGQRRGRLISSP